MKLWTFLGGITPFLASDNKDNIQEQNLEKHNVTINDARKIPNNNFHKSGFTLIKLEKEPVTKDWRTSNVHNEEADINNFYQ